MRTQAKSNAPYGQGISKASGYDGIYSAASDLEALVDRYGKDVLHKVIDTISEDIRKYGDSIYNAEINSYLRTVPPPKHRKKGASRGEQISLKKAIELARLEAKKRGDVVEDGSIQRIIKDATQA